ncbi:unnamed protein product [Ectocarpus sp. 8 AP-2014]
MRGGWGRGVGVIALHRDAAGGSPCAGHLTGGLTKRTCCMWHQLVVMMVGLLADDELVGKYAVPTTAGMARRRGGERERNGGVFLSLFGVVRGARLPVERGGGDQRNRE